jgi:hypothetical protein
MVATLQQQTKTKNMKTKRKHSFLYRNSLSIVVLLLMLFSLGGQFLTGWQDKNEERKENDRPELSLAEYARSGHFIQATFENWESEFLQMTLYVLLTVSLRQQGSSESKKLSEKEEVDREPKAHTKAPWPVKRGGIWLRLYSHSLSMAFALLFLISFVFHFYGSWKNNNEIRLEENLPAQSYSEHFIGSTFWFESFQNWQSEFLSVLSIVVLSIWLREKGSPESKPVDAAYDETGN